MNQNILQILDLSIRVQDEGREKKIIDGVSLSVRKESITALVGGSGSGKTTLGLSTLQLLSPALQIAQGQILFTQDVTPAKAVVQNAGWIPASAGMTGERNLLTLNADQIRAVRGREIAMIFQEPLHAFNPVFKIGEQISEVLWCHGETNPRVQKEKVMYALEQVGMKDPQRVFGSYPHQLSGGMRQRAMIAQAIVSGPSLLIADEPTSSLDVTLQAKIIELFRELRAKLKLSIVLITHDLGMVSHLADDVVVLARGRVVESGTVASVMRNPKDPYTVELIKAAT